MTVPVHISYFLMTPEQSVYKTVRTLCNQQVLKTRVVGRYAGADCRECLGILAEYDRRAPAGTPRWVETHTLSQVRLDFYHAKHGVTVLPNLAGKNGNAWARELLSTLA